MRVPVKDVAHAVFARVIGKAVEAVSHAESVTVGEQYLCAVGVVDQLVFAVDGVVVAADVDQLGAVCVFESADLAPAVAEMVYPVDLVEQIEKLLVGRQKTVRVRQHDDVHA